MPCTGRRKQALLADWHPGLACQHDPCCCTGRGPARPMLGQCPKRVEMFMLCLQELVSPVQNLQQRSAGSPHAPGDSFPSCHHLSTMGTSYLSEVSANMGAVPGRRRSLAFLLVSMQSAADGAAGSSDQPPLWTRENKAGSSAAIGAPGTLHLCAGPFYHHQEHSPATAPHLSHLGSSTDAPKHCCSLAD